MIVVDNARDAEMCPCFFSEGKGGLESFEFEGIEGRHTNLSFKAGTSDPPAFGIPLNKGD